MVTRQRAVFGPPGHRLPPALGYGGSLVLVLGVAAASPGLVGSINTATSQAAVSTTEDAAHETDHGLRAGADGPVAHSPRGASAPSGEAASPAESGVPAPGGGRQVESGSSPAQIVREGTPAAARVLGISVEALDAALRAGASLDDLADTHGVGRDVLAAALLAAATEQINDAVAAGEMTRETADQLISQLPQQVDAAMRQEGGGSPSPRPESGPGRPGSPDPEVPGPPSRPAPGQDQTTSLPPAPPPAADAPAPAAPAPSTPQAPSQPKGPKTSSSSSPRSHGKGRQNGAQNNAPAAGDAAQGQTGAPPAAAPPADEPAVDAHPSETKPGGAKNPGAKAPGAKNPGAQSNKANPNSQKRGRS